jgi:hypothetical protein
MAEPDDIILAHLRELRADTNARFDRLKKRLEGMLLDSANAPRGLIGHRAMVERTISSFEDEMTRLIERIERLEARP